MNRRLCVRERGRRYDVRWFCESSEEWHQILADYRARFRTHAQATYSPRTGWGLPLAEGQRLAAWAERHFAFGEVQWEREWDDPEPAGSNYPGSLSPVEAAYRELALLPSAPAGLVQAAYRWWSKELHPDRGGDGAAMARLNRAMEVIRTGRRSA